MKLVFSKINMMSLLLLLVCAAPALAQQEISGVVYVESAPRGGVEVAPQKGTSAYTNGEGQYTVTVDAKSKYIRFTDLVSGKSKKYTLEGNEKSPINISLDGSPIPEPGAAGSPDAVSMKTQDELVAANDRTYLEELTMYDQAYKHKDYETSLKHWRLVYNRYPKSSLNVYIQGVNMYKGLIAQTDDKDEVMAYVDTITMIYAQRVEMFGNEGFVQGRKATDYYSSLISLDLTDAERTSILKTAYNEFEKSLNFTGDETEPAVLVLYMGVSKVLFRQGELSKDQVLKNYAEVSAIVDKKLAEDTSDKTMIATKEEVDKAFQTSGAADCEALIAYYEPIFSDLENDAEGLQKMLRALDRQDCVDSELYGRAAEAMYELDPTPEAAYSMARLFVKKDQIAEAKEYYKKAIDGETDKELLSRYYYEVASLTFVKDHSYSQAKAYAKKAIANDPNSGKAYLLLGDIYAQGAKTYSSDAFERSTVYWVAVDYYSKAKRVQPDMVTEANKKIGLYSVYFPDSETLFFQGLTVGASYKVGGWIGETTKVRGK